VKPLDSLPVTPELLDALRSVMRTNGWVYYRELAKVLGVTSSTVYNWFNRKTSVIRPQLAQRVRELVEGHWPEKQASGVAGDGQSHPSVEGEVLRRIYDGLSAAGQQRVDEFIRREVYREMQENQQRKAE